MRERPLLEAPAIPSINFRFIGTSPLLMHSERGVNILDPEVKQKKALTGKRKKTDDDMVEISRLEWGISLYFDPKVGPFVPGQNVEATILAGAKLEKRGKDVTRGIYVEPDFIPLKYTGPRTKDALWADEHFRDIRSVGQQTARIMRCRPKFMEWSIDFTLIYDQSVFDRDDLIRICRKGGQYCGLCDFRPRFGRFSVEVLS